MPNRRIMVVDDDELILAMAAVALRRLGHAAATFSDPAAALAALREAPSDFRLVICDLRLGTDSGLDVVAALKATTPEIPVLMVSGAFAADEVERALAAGALALLPKRVFVTDLDSAIRQYAAP